MSENRIVTPREGETVKIVQTLYGGDHPKGYGKIRIYPPATVMVERVRTRTFRNEENQIEGYEVVRLRDMATGETYPEVKMGALLHAAGILTEDDNDGRGFFLSSELRSVSDKESVSPHQRQLEALREQMLAEFRLAIEATDATWELGSALTYLGNPVADAGTKIKVLGRVGTHYRVEVIGGLTFLVTETDLQEAAPAPTSVQATA